MSDVTAQASTLLGEQSPPSEHAIQAEQERNAQIKDEVAGLVDNKGQSFDPSLHEVNADGSPRLSPTGKLRRKRGNAQRKKGNGADRQPGPSIIGKPGGGGVATGVPGETISQGALAVAVTTVDSIQALTMMIGGEEWKYRTIPDMGVDERKAGVETWARYFEANNIRDIPPNLALVMWGAAYAIPRFFAPKTKTRVKRAAEWIKGKFSRKGKANGPRPDSGDDREREIHTSSAVNETVQTERSGSTGFRPAS